MTSVTGKISRPLGTQSDPSGVGARKPRGINQEAFGLARMTCSGTGSDLANERASGEGNFAVAARSTLGGRLCGF